MVLVVSVKLKYHPPTLTFSYLDLPPHLQFDFCWFVTIKTPQGVFISAPSSASYLTSPYSWPISYSHKRKTEPERDKRINPFYPFIVSRVYFKGSGAQLLMWMVLKTGILQFVGLFSE